MAGPCGLASEVRQTNRQTFNADGRQPACQLGHCSVGWTSRRLCCLLAIWGIRTCRQLAPVRWRCQTAVTSSGGTRSNSTDDGRLAARCRYALKRSGLGCGRLRNPGPRGLCCSRCRRVLPRRRQRCCRRASGGRRALRPAALGWLAPQVRSIISSAPALAACASWSAVSAARPAHALVGAEVSGAPQSLWVPVGGDDSAGAEKFR